MKRTVDWYQVFEFATEERTIYYVCRNLIKYHYFWTVPNNLRNIWHTAYIGNIHRNRKLLAESTRLTAYLNKNSVMVLPTKGISLIQLMSSITNVRILSDIDYLTSESNMPAISELMKHKGFHAVYIDDADLFSKTRRQNGYDTLFYKPSSLPYHSVDFCYGLDGKEKIFSFLLQNMTEPYTDSFHIAQALLLYLSAYDSWGGHYITADIKHFMLSKLIDIQLYETAFINKERIHALETICRNFNIQVCIDEVRNTLSYYKKGGYLQ